ncbi:MAG: NAD+ synthase [Longimicrobiales bacterium]
MSTLRIGLAQINPTVGDFDGNFSIIERCLAQARDLAVDLVAFPELALCGYPPEDLLLKPSFAAANRRTLERLASKTKGLTVVAGYVDRKADLFNSAAVLHDGSHVTTYHKQRLPNYGVFDELRYFKPGTGEVLVRVRDAWVGVTVCEDIWLPGGPVGRLARAGADVIVNINASPFNRGKAAARHRMLGTRASDHACFVAYVNMVGGQDELVFDGDSSIYDPEGDLVAEATPFAEELLVADLELEQVFRARLHDPRRRHALRDEPRSVVRHVLPETAAPSERPEVPAAAVVVHDELAEVYEALVVGTRDYLRKNGFEHVVLGLSGGLDSAMVATIAVDALGADAVTGVLLPSPYSSEHSRVDALALAENLGFDTLVLPIEGPFRALHETLAPVFEGREPDVTEENLQARVRGVLLMALSNKFGWLLLTTGNKSELATGYATLYGDMAGGFAVLKDVPKTLVQALAAWRNERDEGEGPIPRNTIEKPPSAELRPDQYDTDSLPSYDVLDPILERYVEQDWSIPEMIAEGHDEEIVRRVVRLVDVSEYKRRQAPPGVKITERAFGKDRRVPTTSKFGSE